MKATKRTVLLTGEMEREVYRQALDIDGYSLVNVDAYHPLDRMKAIHEWIDSSDQPIAFITNSDVTASQFNNAVLDGSIPQTDVEVIQVMDGMVTPIAFGDYGYDIPWMSGFLDDLFERTLKIQEEFQARG